MSATIALEKEGTKSTNGKKPEPTKQDLGYRIQALRICQEFLDSGINELQATLPWSVSPKKIPSEETVTVAGMPLAKVQGIPLNVTLVVEQLNERINEAFAKVPTDTPMPRYYFNRGAIAGLVTVILKYYHDPVWTLQDTIEKLNEAQITALWKFLDEQRFGDAVAGGEESEGNDQ